MPLTALDPVSALVVIDLQQGLRAYPTLRPLSEIIDGARRLADAFRDRGLPVVLVNAAGRPPGRTDERRPPRALPPDWIALVPELGRHDADLLLTKHAPGAFADGTLAPALRARGVTQVVVVGVSSSNGVEATARQAYDLGFHVTLPVDAITDVDAQAHAHAVTRIYPRIAETGSVADLLALLSRPPGARP